MPIKLLFLRPGKFAPKGLFPGHPGDRKLAVYSGEIWAKIPKNTPVSKKYHQCNWLFHPLFENRAVLDFPCLLAYQSATH